MGGKSATTDDSVPVTVVGEIKASDVFNTDLKTVNGVTGKLTPAGQTVKKVWVKARAQPYWMWSTIIVGVALVGVILFSILRRPRAAV